MSSLYQTVYPLWNENNIPFAQPDDAEKVEHLQPPTGDNVERFTDVVNPTITFFPAAGPGAHPAVLVCPGGGYSILAWNHEGRDICGWLNNNGFSCFLLKYRCPGRRQAAHADAARAMRFIRANAEKFGIIPDKVGCIGFSAGAHLCATITAPADMTPYEPVDEIDNQSFLSNFTALIYPAYLIDGEQSLNLAPEFKITETTAPTFTVQTEDDGVQCENAIAWFLNLKKFNRPCELHVFAEGGHGYGLLRRGYPVNDWYLAAENWFRRQQ